MIKDFSFVKVSAAGILFFCACLIINFIAGSPRLYLESLILFFSNGFPADAGHVLFAVKLQRLLAGTIAGMGMGICGICYSIIFRNNLASATSLGSVHSASFALLIAAFFGIQNLGVMYFIATLGALGPIVLICYIAPDREWLCSPSAVVPGMAAAMFFCGAIVFLISSSGSEQEFSYLFYLYGEFTQRELRSVLLSIPTFISTMQHSRTRILISYRNPCKELPKKR